jgi:DNA polymerase
VTTPAFDFETYSEAGHVWVPAGVNPKKPLGYWSCLPNAPQGKKGISIVSTAAYAEHPTTEVLCLKYDLGDGLRRFWRPGMPNPTDLFDYLAAGGTLEAHHAMFERLIWEHVCTRLYGWPPLNPYQLRCSMATARTNNLPGKLEKLAEVLRLPVQKDKDGTRLLNKFSVPRNPTKTDPRTRIRPDDDPADAERLYGYCDTDVLTEQHAVARMRPMSAAELEFWLVDQEINHRGLGIDRAGVRDCLAVLGEALAQYGQEHVIITGGLEAGQLAEVRGWLAAQGLHLPDMQADTVELALSRPDLSPVVRRVLEIRSLIGSASVKKLYAMEQQASYDDRLRGLIVHHGARTGRPTGEGPQPLNLPRNGPKLVWCGSCERPHKQGVDACPWCAVPCPPVERKGKWQPAMLPYVLEIMASRCLSLVEWFFGDALLAISGCLRGLFVSRPGYDLIASDYSAIEAVVSAAIAGEQWRLDVFAQGVDIYLAGASKITGRSVEFYEAYLAEHGEHHPDRQLIGKISELACGFGGWINSYIAFGSKEPDEVIKQQILAWRAASPAIVEAWGGQKRGWDNPELYGIEGAVITAIQYPGTVTTMRCLTFHVENDVLVMTLPSGRQILYHEPRLEPGDGWRSDTLSISYMTWNSDPKKGPIGWVRMRTWGSRIFENAVQAIAHDILRGAILRLRAAGYPTVLHVYDEIVVEVPEGLGSVDEVERLMLPVESWAAGWPIRAAGGWRAKRYRKG